MVQNAELTFLFDLSHLAFLLLLLLRRFADLPKVVWLEGIEILEI